MEATPYIDSIKTINILYNMGHEIIIYTARGTINNKYEEDLELTKKQLESWGVMYSRIERKIFFDILLDDKALQSTDTLKKMFDKIGGKKIE
jgi:hypothetical protein